MARLSGRGKKRGGRGVRGGRTGGQLGKRNLGLVRATGLSSGIGRREWSIRGLLSKNSLHLELDGGSDLRAGTTVRRKGKNLLRHFAKRSGNLGQGRAASTHKTADEQAPARAYCVGGEGGALSRLFGADLIALGAPDKRENEMRLQPARPPRWTRTMGLANLQKAIADLLVLPLGSSWSLLSGSDKAKGALALVGVAENFQPGFDVSGIEAPLVGQGSPARPPRGPHLAAKSTTSVVEPAARVPPGIHCFGQGWGMTTG